MKFQNRFALLDERIELMKKNDLIFVLHLLGISCVQSTADAVEEKHKNLLTEAHFVSLQDKKVYIEIEYLVLEE